MSTTTQSAHREERTPVSPVSGMPPVAAAPIGRHRGGRSGPVHAGTAALLRRAATLGAAWSVAFGLVALAEGWAQLAVIAGGVGVLTALGVVVSSVLDAGAG